MTTPTQQTSTLAEVSVNGDEVRLRQIITNQLTNALKFVPPGGIVSVTLHHDAEWVELRVADTGPGIPPDDVPRVFDRFYRGSTRSTARAGGSGIGLAIAAELAAAHGGTITADSAPGHGTIFTTRLPARTTENAPRNREADTDSP